jgi:hypothetical protein
MGVSIREPLRRFAAESLERFPRGALGALCVLAWLLVPVVAPGGEPASNVQTSAGAASDSLGLAVDEIVFCAAIKDKQPTGVADTFPSDIYGVYCYTRLVGAAGPTSVKHVWYRGGARVTAKTLAVRASPWRTWSLREMPEEWKGEWRVDVVSPDGEVLASRKFVTR